MQQTTWIMIMCGVTVILTFLVFLYSIISFPVHIQDRGSGEITFYMKGADTVMSNIVQYSDWLEEEVN